MTLLQDVSLEQFAILLVAIGWAIVKWAEATGRMPSSRLLRDENTDLTQRNKTLEKERDRERERHAIEERRLNDRIAVLESKVRELEVRDQAAVLEKLDLLEQARRADHQEAMGVWTRVATALEGGR